MDSPIQAMIAPVTPLQQNCTIVWCAKTKKAATIDPGGDHQDLVEAITTKLWPLGSDVQFVPGHGPMSTFGAERETNPFVADKVLARAKV